MGTHLIVGSVAHVRQSQLFLAHLSRRLMGELIAYQSLRRPSVRPSVRRPSVCQHFRTSSPLKPLGKLNSSFIWRLYRTREQSLFKWSWSHEQDGRHAHIWLKTFKTLLFQNQKADDLGTWYVALEMWGLPSMLK